MCDEQCQCCICLDAYARPVSIPCGHTFCLACIGEYWRRAESCLCPLCFTVFPPESELRPHRDPEDLCFGEEGSADGGGLLEAGEVPCDVCLKGRPYKAQRSCLECLTSYCSEHLEPHYQNAELRRHQLVTVWKNLGHSLCQQHGQPLDRFCRTDRSCICATCARNDHWGHRIISAVTESRKKKIQLRKIMQKMQRTIQDKLKMLEEARLSSALGKGNVGCSMRGSFSEPERSIERCQAALTDVMVEKQKAAEKRAEEPIGELEQDIAELQRRNAELERLSHFEDHIQFLQTFPFLHVPPRTKLNSPRVRRETRRGSGCCEFD